ncbi:MAG: hypothetical protein ABI867_28375 [Kofleriaceae bacterium]
MRCAAVVVLALAACGGGGDGKSDKPKTDVADDERCDPTESRVCVGASVVECNSGTLGRRIRSCHDGCKHGACVASCDADGVELIYVVDTSNNFLSFDPRKLPDDPFHLIGRLDCTSFGTPFSMSVDRGGIAWVLYSSGELFRVSIQDAKCQPTTYRAGTGGVATFGMGFVTDAAKSKSEKLYIAANNGTRGLAYIDTAGTTPAFKAVGTIAATVSQNPELTGTSEAKLFGFYPGSFDDVSFVQEIDRASGAALGTRWSLGTQPIGTISAYAFAHWGGTFYIFLTADDSTVRTINRQTGAYKTVLEHVPYRISGAGVSTCAPELDNGKPPPPRAP